MCNVISGCNAISNLFTVNTLRDSTSSLFVMSLNVGQRVICENSSSALQSLWSRFRTCWSQWLKREISRKSKGMGISKYCFSALFWFILCSSDSRLYLWQEAGGWLSHNANSGYRHILQLAANGAGPSGYGAHMLKRSCPPGQDRLKAQERN